MISCISSEKHVVELETARAAAAKRQGRPLLMVDISVPRSIDPGINTLENVFLYDIDDLKGISAENLARRTREIERCEQIVRREAEGLAPALSFPDVEEVIARLQGWFTGTAQAELRAWVALRCRELFVTFGEILKTHKRAEHALGIPTPPDPPAPPEG